MREFKFFFFLDLESLTPDKILKNQMPSSLLKLRTENMNTKYTNRLQFQY